MKNVLVFDLDDTLYDELTYVHSGFRAVARFLANEYGIEYAFAYTLMQEKLAGGRGRIFDDTLIQLKLYSQKNVHRCLSVYRLHEPVISLFSEAALCLERFKAWPLFIVTDGNKIVQWNKFRALGLPQHVRGCLITHRFGVRHAKPSPYCFQKICRMERVEPRQVVYVADNPCKDFVGIKPLGFKTVRVLTGQHRNVVKAPEYEADVRIASLAELNQALVDTVFQVRR